MCPDDLTVAWRMSVAELTTHLRNPPGWTFEHELNSNITFPSIPGTALPNDVKEWTLKAKNLIVGQIFLYSSPTTRSDSQLRLNPLKYKLAQSNISADLTGELRQAADKVLQQVSLWEHKASSTIQMPPPMPKYRDAAQVPRPRRPCDSGDIIDLTSDDDGIEMKVVHRPSQGGTEVNIASHIHLHYAGG
jgi:hypothetical protein